MAYQVVLERFLVFVMLKFQRFLKEADRSFGELLLKCVRTHPSLLFRFVHILLESVMTVLQALIFYFGYHAMLLGQIDPILW